MSQQKYSYVEFSGALQQRTSNHIRKVNEVTDVINGDFTKVLGSIVRRNGAQKYDSSLYPTIPTDPVDKPTLGAAIARYPAGAEVWMASNISAGTSATVRRWDNVSAWVDVQAGLIASAEVNFAYSLDEMWISSYDPTTDTIGQSYTVDASHNSSMIRQLQFGPNARFFIEFNGNMMAANVTVGGTRYRDRLYQSSGPTGVVAFARSAQTNPPAITQLIDQVPTMSSNSTPLGVAFASTEFDGTRQAWTAFDDNISDSNRWIASSGSVTGTLAYDFGSGVTKIITSYALTGPNSTDNDANRYPLTWTFEGSNNNSTWTTIDTQTSAPTWGLSERRVYATSNTTAYRYYRVNVSVNQGGTPLAINQLELLINTATVSGLTVAVDSARYTKVGQTLDVYAAGTNTKNFTVTLTAVDKINDTISFTPFTQSFLPAGVNTTTDIITVTDATQFTTGTPVIFQTTSGLPAPLTVGTTYYAIFKTGTTFQVATNLINAQLGVAVNLTTTGSGTHAAMLSYVFGNKDEFWGSGRKGLLTYYWNEDYRDATSADWIKLPPTLDATNDISAVYTISSRLFIWTLNAMMRYDGQNMVGLYNDVGCASIRSIATYQSFMVWVDTKGQVWARNEEAGTQDVISEAIAPTMALVPQSNLLKASAVCVGKKYKLTLGQITLKDGTIRTLRVVYDFESNTWTKEWFTPQMPVQLEYKYSGTILPHFFDEHGNMWVDELGNDDATVQIPLDVSVGDDNFGIDEIKSYKGIKVYGKNCSATKVLAQIDGGEWYDIGELTGNVTALPMPQNMVKGVLFNLRFTNSSTGDPVQIDAATVYYQTEEDTFRATAR